MKYFYFIVNTFPSFMTTQEIPLIKQYSTLLILSRFLNIIPDFTVTSNDKMLSDKILPQPHLYMS